jgi:hypothetical protein
MKGRKSRATGGVNEDAKDLGRNPERRNIAPNIFDEAEKRKSGGKVRGMAAKMHAGRKPRKSGGSCDSGNPFSSARQGTPAKGRKLDMEME